MDDVEKIYNEGKLLVRAMDQPEARINQKGKYYECHSWVDEFYSLMNGGLYSLSTTLVVLNVGVKTYKNIGFLINSDWADCFHIAKSDSGSCGNIQDGDFQANKADFNTLEELYNHIKFNNDKSMNEVNINVKLDGVVGLFINKCTNMEYLLGKIYVIKTLLKAMTGIDYPIYSYDWNIGKMELIELSKEKEDMIINNLKGNQIYCWPDDVDSPFFIPIESSQYSK